MNEKRLLDVARAPLERENYRNKFHSLIYLDEMAHSHKMMQEYVCAPEKEFMIHYTDTLVLLV